MSTQELKYQKIIDWIKGEIEAGRLKPGDRLMTEEKLSESFDSSRQTVRRATQTLVEDNILTRVQGSGTYVGERSRKLARPRTMNIAVVSTFYESYIFPRTLRGIEKKLSEEGYTVQVSFTDNDPANEARILQSLLEKNNIDGIIMEPSCGALPSENVRYYREFKERGIPIIFFNDVYPWLDLPCVRLDDKAVAKDATRLLIEAGHKRIAGIFKLDDGQGHRRYSGFCEAMHDAKLSIEFRQLFWLDTESVLDMRAEEDYLFKRIEGCTGVVCYNDEVAVQFIDMVLRRGMRVPEDISVVGIDDSDLAELCRVRFTSFPHPKERLGRRAAKNLLGMIENPGYDGNHIYSAKPVLRDSICEI